MFKKEKIIMYIILRQMFEGNDEMIMVKDIVKNN